MAEKPRRSKLAISILANQNGAIGENARPLPDFLSALANARDLVTRPF